MKNLFINTKEKKIENVLQAMENSFVSAGKGQKFDDSIIQKKLQEFYDYTKDKIGGTYLYNLKDFIL